MYINPYEFGMVVLIAIIIAVSAYLIAILRQTLFLLGQVREIFATHDSDIHATLTLFPLALANINLLIVNLTKTIDQTNHTFRSLQMGMDNTVDDLHDGLETFTIYAKVIGEIFKSVFSKIA